ncbi:hypothetical protein [Paraburkholderia sp. EG304]|uniref:hypothetical protein n=1 Tax=Paraburkholderia sp. EG304 TaxID=3237015 RepID=UPI003979647A
MTPDEGAGRRSKLQTVVRVIVRVEPLIERIRILSRREGAAEGAAARNRPQMQ